MAAVPAGQMQGVFMTGSTMPITSLGSHNFTWFFQLTTTYSRPVNEKRLANGKTAAGVNLNGVSNVAIETNSAKAPRETLDTNYMKASQCLEAEQQVSQRSHENASSNCSTVSPVSGSENERRVEFKAESEELKRVFQRFDEDHDDFICAGDLRQFMSRLGFSISAEEAVSMLQTVDQNGDGKVEFDEFCSLYQSLDEGDTASSKINVHTDDEDGTLQEAFSVFDKNGDGFITAKELQSVLLDLGMPEGKSLKSCERMIQGVDADGNGEIDINEFKQMMSSDLMQL